MSKFKVGDRVRSLVEHSDKWWAWHGGREGTVRVVGYGSDKNAVGVEFDSGDEGHDLDRAITHQRGYWFFSPEGSYGQTRGERLADLEKIGKPKAEKKPTQEYKGNGKHEWERVTNDTQRLRVPGGWLYGDDARCVMTFVPMPEVVKHKV